MSRLQSSYTYRTPINISTSSHNPHSNHHIPTMNLTSLSCYIIYPQVSRVSATLIFRLTYSVHTTVTKSYSLIGRYGSGITFQVLISLITYLISRVVTSSHIPITSSVRSKYSHRKFTSVNYSHALFTYTSSSRLSHLAPIPSLIQGSSQTYITY